MPVTRTDQNLGTSHAARCYHDGAGPGLVIRMISADLHLWHGRATDRSPSAYMRCSRDDVATLHAMLGEVLDRPSIRTYMAGRHAFGVRPGPGGTYVLSAGGRYHSSDEADLQVAVMERDVLVALVADLDVLVALGADASMRALVGEGACEYADRGSFGVALHAARASS